MKSDRLILFVTLLVIIFCLKLMFFDFDTIQKLTTCSLKECNCNDVKFKLEIDQNQEDYTEHYYDQFEDIKGHTSLNKNFQMCFLNYSNLGKNYRRSEIFLQTKINEIPLN